MNTPVSSPTPPERSSDETVKSLVGVADRNFVYRVKLGIGIAMLVAAGVVVFTSLTAPPSDSAVLSFARKQMARQGQEPENAYVTDRSYEGSPRKYTVSGTVKRSPEIRYVDAFADGGKPWQVPSLPDWLTLDRSSWLRCQKLVSGPNGARLLQLAGLTPQEEALLRVVVLRPLPAGDGGESDSVGGEVTAERHGLSWRLSWEPAKVDKTAGTEQEGQRLSEIKGEVYIIDRPSDREKLIELAQNVSSWSERLGKATETLVAEKKAGYLELLKPKALFAGTATATASSGGTAAKAVRVFLEITEVRDEDGRLSLSALLRNDGGWNDARLFTGELACKEDGIPALLLTSTDGDAIDRAGPLLQRSYDNFDLESDIGNAQLLLRLQGRSLVYAGKEIALQLEPLTAEQRTAEIAAIKGQYARAVEAAQDGRVFKGTITYRASGDVETWIMRFSVSGGGGLTVEMEQDNQEKKISFMASVITNRYRGAGCPIRLDGFDNYPSDDLAAMREILPFDLMVGEGGKLRGENTKLLFRFEPVATDTRVEEGNASLNTGKPRSR